LERGWGQPKGTEGGKLQQEKPFGGLGGRGRTKKMSLKIKGGLYGPLVKRNREKENSPRQ